MDSSGAWRRWADGNQAIPEPRFLCLAQVPEVLNISGSQTYALVRSGGLPAIRIGGRGQWRVEATALKDFITRMYEDTKRFLEEHPDGGDETPPPEE